jgi:DNA-binding GntR family transcriptional regulator
MVHADADNVEPLAGIELVPRRSLREMTIGQIRAAIEDGILKAGQRVTELGLARKLGVAQSTVREALVELEHQGFIRRHGPRKICITNLSTAEIADIYLVRKRLEVLAVELLTTADECDLSQSEDQYRQMVQAASNGAESEFYRADLNFHRKLWEAAGNRSLVESLERLVPKLFAFGIIRQAPPTRQRLLESAEEHGRLLQLIRDRNQAAATELMEASMTRAWIEDDSLAR